MKVIVLCLLFLTGACIQSSNDVVLKEIELTKFNTLQLHDSLMVDLGRLKQIDKQLRSMSKETDSARFKIDEAILEVNKADESMWDWMHNFDVTYSHTNDSITLSYFQTTFEDIKHVRKKFDSAFYKGNKLLD